MNEIEIWKWAYELWMDSYVTFVLSQNPSMNKPNWVTHYFASFLWFEVWNEIAAIRELEKSGFLYQVQPERKTSVKEADTASE